MDSPITLSKLPYSPKSPVNDRKGHQEQPMRKSLSSAPVWKPPIRCEPPTDFILPEMKRVMVVASLSLLGGIRPQLISEGMGGVYLCRDRKGSPLAIFKPRDEEPCAPNNPKNLSGSLGDTGIKKGIRSGEHAIREVAAFALDRGLARVPPTIYVSLDPVKDTTKVGSFQLFVPSRCTSGDLGPSVFPTRDVQGIAALDMRLMNADRHDGNILVTDGGRLVPIDHGCCLPDSLDVCWFEWTWLSWPQLTMPIVPAVREHLLSLDIEADARLLQKMGVRPACIHVMCIASRFLVACVRARPELTLAQIASWMCRDESETPSQLESLVAKARWRAIVSQRRAIVTGLAVQMNSDSGREQDLECLAKHVFWKSFDQTIHSFLKHVRVNEL